MMDRIIIAFTRREARLAVAVRALGAWWFDSAVGRGLRALARLEEKSGGLSAQPPGRGRK